MIDDMSTSPSPAERVAEAYDRWGEVEVVRRCAGLLALDPAEPVAGDGLELSIVLGHLSDRAWLAGGKPPGHAYWARVWAARALRYVWRDTAAVAVMRALSDEQWRVKEMAAKVVADREIGNAAAVLDALADDDVPRVRRAAVGALAAIGEAEQADTIRALTDDPEPTVARAAATALAKLGRRLDRPL